MYSLGRSRASHRSTSRRPDLSRRSCTAARATVEPQRSSPTVGRATSSAAAHQDRFVGGPFSRKLAGKKCLCGPTRSCWCIGACVTPCSGHTYGSPGEPHGTDRCGWALVPLSRSYETVEPAWDACLRPAGPPNSRSSGPTSMLSRAPSRRLHLRYFRRARRYMPLQMSVGIAQHII